MFQTKLDIFVKYIAREQMELKWKDRNLEVAPHYPPDRKRDQG